MLLCFPVGEPLFHIRILHLPSPQAQHTAHAEQRNHPSVFSSAEAYTNRYRPVSASRDRTDGTNETADVQEEEVDPSLQAFELELHDVRVWKKLGAIVRGGRSDPDKAKEEERRADFSYDDIVRERNKETEKLARREAGVEASDDEDGGEGDADITGFAPTDFIRGEVWASLSYEERNLMLRCLSTDELMVLLKRTRPEIGKCGGKWRLLVVLCVVQFKLLYGLHGCEMDCVTFVQ